MGTEDDGPLSLRVSTDHLGLSSVPPWNLLATELNPIYARFGLAGDEVISACHRMSAPGAVSQTAGDRRHCRSSEWKTTRGPQIIHPIPRPTGNQRSAHGAVARRSLFHQRIYRANSLV